MKGGGATLLINIMKTEKIEKEISRFFRLFKQLEEPVLFGIYNLIV